MTVGQRIPGAIPPQRGRKLGPPAVQPAVDVGVGEDDRERVGFEALRAKIGGGELRVAGEPRDRHHAIRVGHPERLLELRASHDDHACAGDVAPDPRDDRDEAEGDVAQAAVPADQEVASVPARGAAHRAIEGGAGQAIGNAPERLARTHRNRQRAGASGGAASFAVPDGGAPASGAAGRTTSGGG